MGPVSPRVGRLRPEYILPEGDGYLGRTDKSVDYDNITPLTPDRVPHLCPIDKTQTPKGRPQS